MFKIPLRITYNNISFEEIKKTIFSYFNKKKQQTSLGKGHNIKGMI